MLIYNVTTKIDPSIHEKWVGWMKDHHIPAVMQTGCFTHYHFVRVLDIDEMDGPTYAVQYFIENRAQYDKYIDTYASALRQDSTQLWGQLMIGFRSLMAVVN
jgi:L-rhamnose isomerase